MTLMVAVCPGRRPSSAGVQPRCALSMPYDHDLGVQITVPLTLISRSPGTEASSSNSRPCFRLTVASRWK